MSVIMQGKLSFVCQQWVIVAVSWEFCTLCTTCCRGTKFNVNTMSNTQKYIFVIYVYGSCSWYLPLLACLCSIFIHSYRSFFGAWPDLQDQLWYVKTLSRCLITSLYHHLKWQLYCWCFCNGGILVTWNLSCDINPENRVFHLMVLCHWGLW